MEIRKGDALLRPLIGGMRHSRLWAGLGVTAAALVAGPLLLSSFAFGRSTSVLAPIPSLAGRISEGPHLAETVFEAVSATAKDLSLKPYEAPSDVLPDVFANLDYDGYRRLRPRSEAAIWADDELAFEVLPLPRGGLFRTPVSLAIVSETKIEPVTRTDAYIDAQDFPSASTADLRALGSSGWRMLKPSVDKDGVKSVSEYAVFQGGSYFRAVADGLSYGLSARALALGTASPEGEEFPELTAFWIMKPDDDSDVLQAVALMDSPSMTGALRFDVSSGTETLIDVRADFYPRTSVAQIGVAPMSSMFHHGSADRRDNDDYRPEVHDSDGLLIKTASGEQIWRPVTNPKRLEVSSFAGDDVAGFGLLQRRRDFGAYADLEANYEKRPSLWVEPVDGWGAGNVMLVEIPTRDEYNDNIVAFWRPAEAWQAGEKRSLAYRLNWNGPGPAHEDVARIESTWVGGLPADAKARRFVIDFTGDETFGALVDPELDVWATGGEISNLHVIPAPETDGQRIVFDFAPGAADSVELHAAIRSAERQLSETWLYRWTPE